MRRAPSNVIRFPGEAPASPGRGTAQVAVTLAVAVGSLYFLRDFFLPLVFAVVLTVVLTPVVAGMERIRIPRVAAVFLAMTLVVTGAAGTAFVLGNELIEVVEQMPRYRQNIRVKVRAMRESRPQ